MKIVIDTNILLVSIKKRSPYRLIFDSLLSKRFDLIISNDILNEYMEIKAQKSNDTVATNISEMLLTMQNVQKQDIFYKWNLIDATRKADSERKRQSTVCWRTKESRAVGRNRGLPPIAPDGRPLRFFIMRRNTACAYCALALLLAHSIRLPNQGLKTV